MANAGLSVSEHTSRFYEQLGTYMYSRVEDVTSGGDNWGCLSKRDLLVCAMHAAADSEQNTARPCGQHGRRIIGKLGERYARDSREP
ncbi:hypothetical protein FGB62_69g07 [Gracilaria domingensis]|nr:hypothetical protein FGB62_69g07 [Gracilaria domingensis]